MDCIRPIPARARGWGAALLVVPLLLSGPPLLAQQAPAEPPADWGPISINLENFDYPFPVEHLPLTLYGQNVNMAYMDVAPAGTPNGRSVVFLHGLNFFGEYWGDTMEFLRNEGFRVIAVDLIGFGRSSKPIMPYIISEHASNIRQLLDHLDISDAAIVGHSFGGAIATRFAFLYPDVTTHLGLVNQIGMSDGRPGRGYNPPAELTQAGGSRTYQSVRSSIERYYVEWRPEFERHVRVHWGWTLSPEWGRLSTVRSLNSQALSIETIVYDWPHIQARTLVIGGEEDGPNYVAQARNVAASIPNAEIVLFPNVGHNPHLEAPDLFRPALLEFLRSDPLGEVDRD